MAPLDPASEINVSPSGSTPQVPEPTVLTSVSVPAVLGPGPTLPISLSHHVYDCRINKCTRVPLACCVWSANSFAYDTFFMLLFSMYRDSDLSESWRPDFMSTGPWFRSISGMFEDLIIPTDLTDLSCFSNCRDNLRTTLSEYDTVTFPRSSPGYTTIFKVFGAFASNST